MNGLLEDSVRPRRLSGASGRPLNFTLRTSPFSQVLFLMSDSSGLLARAMKDRLRNSNRPLMSTQHSGPRVSRALAPRSLGSDFRSEVDQVLRAPV